MNLRLSLSKALTLFPDKIAIIDGRRRFSYRQLGERVAALAAALRRRGFRPGHRLAMLAPNCHEYLEAYYACATAGFVLVPLNTRLAPGEVAHIVDHAGARALLVDARQRELAELAVEKLDAANQIELIWARVDRGEGNSLLYEELLEQAPADDGAPAKLKADMLAQLYYTSGTTGQPKGVMLTQGNVTFHALSAIAELGLSDADRWLHAAPLFHLADAWATFAITWVGGTHVFIPSFDADATLDVMQKQRITLTNLIPTMLNLMVNAPKIAEVDLSSLRIILSGGAPIAPETVRRIIDSFGCDYIQTYGMTETSPYLTVSRLNQEQLTEMTAEEQLELKSRTGRPFLGVELRVARPDGNSVTWNDEEVGEIWARGPTVTPGYWNAPQLTEEAFTDGWLRTGDLAVVDPSGSINIVDRIKDTIISGGENIYSTEVEHVLYVHPAVLEAAVIGVPDAHWGEAVKAVVVLKEGVEITSAELIAQVKAELAHYKAPKSVEFVAELPKTGSGKISKAALRKKFS